MVITRLQQQQIFQQETQRLSHIDLDLELSSSLELSDIHIVYRPIFLSLWKNN